MKRLFYGIFGGLFTRIICVLLNWKYRKVEKRNRGIMDSEVVFNFYDVTKLISKIYGRYNWVLEINGVAEKLSPPPLCYEHFLARDLDDARDSFACLLYHCLKNSRIESYLLTTETDKLSHCAVLFKLSGEWHVVDYLNIYDSCETAKDTVEKYNKSFLLRYGKKKVLYNDLIGYNFSEQKFYREDKKIIK